MSGILVTCFRNVEAKCTNEVYYLLSQAYEALGLNKAEEEEKEGEPKSFEEQIKSEVTGLKDRKEKPFLALDTKNLQCIVFIKALKGIDTTLIMNKLFDLIRERAIKSVKFSQRMMPMQVVCVGKIEEIRLEATRLVADSFDAAVPTDYCVAFESRLNDSLDRMTVINMIAEIVGPLHKVNLTKPTKVILVQVFKNHAGLSILSNWVENRKYNVQEVLKAVITAQE